MDILLWIVGGIIALGVVLYLAMVILAGVAKLIEAAKGRPGKSSWERFR